MGLISISKKFKEINKVKARFLYSGLILFAGFMIAGCGGGDGEDVVEKSSFQMPIKENTWVRKETVRRTKDDFMSSDGKASTQVPVDSELVAKLKTPVSLTIKTKEECYEEARFLDKKRTEVQKRGGLWHAYEKVPEAKRYSDYGMQLDSQTNRLIFSLVHICKNARGYRLDGWGKETVRVFEKLGKEGYRNHFLALGEVPGDVDQWVRFAEYSIKNRSRKIDYSEIGESLGRTSILIDLYEDLANKKVKSDASLKTFLTEGASLLNVINESFKSDPQLVVALQDEEVYPFEDIKGEM